GRHLLRPHRHSRPRLRGRPVPPARALQPVLAPRGNRLRRAGAGQDDDSRPAAGRAVRSRGPGDAGGARAAALRRPAGDLLEAIAVHRSRVLHAALVLAAAAGVAALLVFHGPNWGKVAHALAEMSWQWALVAVGLNLA